MSNSILIQSCRSKNIDINKTDFNLNIFFFKKFNCELDFYYTTSLYTLFLCVLFVAIGVAGNE